MARDRDVAEAIMRNARAAWRDQLRNQVRRGEPGLDDAEVEARVDELVRATRSAAGRRGAAQVRRAAIAARNVLDRHADIESLAKDLLAAIEGLADPTRDCPHVWPAVPSAEEYCARCGLIYDEYLGGREVAA